MISRLNTHLIAIALVLSPWFLGGIFDWATACMGAVAWLALALTFVELLREPRFQVPRVLWLFALPLAVGLCQLAPIPLFVIDAVSPPTSLLRSKVAVPGALDSAPMDTISLVTGATACETAKYWVFLSYLALGSLALRSRENQRFLVTCVAANGLVLTLVSLFQKFSWNGKVLWTIPSQSIAGFGPFINKNNGAGYLCLVLGCVMALVATMMRQRWSVDPWHVSGCLVGSRGRSRFYQDNVVLAMLGTTGLIWLGLLVSRSRGAFLAAVVATIVSGIVFRWYRTRGMLVFCALALLGAMAMTLWSRQAATVSSRLSTLADAKELQSVRVRHWSDDVVLARQYWLTGTGLGSYRHVNRPHQTFDEGRWFWYSENQYLECLIIGGVVGLVTLLTLIARSAWCVWKLSSVWEQHPEAIIFATFALSSQVVAACFDFGLYHSPNFMLLAVSVGMVLGIEARRRDKLTASGETIGTLSRLHWPRQLALPMILLAGIPALATLGTFANVELAMGGFGTRVDVDDASPHDAEDARARIERLQSALRLCPRHPFGWVQLANLHVLQSRADLYQELRAVTVAESRNDDLWSKTELLHIGALVQQLSQTRPQLAGRVAETQTGRMHLVAAYEALRNADHVNPFVPEVYSGLALLEAALGSDSEVSLLAHLQRAVFLAPQSASMHYQAGLVAFLSGHELIGLKWIDHAQTLKATMPSYVVRFAKTFLTPQQFIQYFQLPAPEEILVLADAFFAEPGDQLWRATLAQRVLDDLKGSNEPLEVLLQARAHRMAGQSGEALQFYAKAVHQKPSETQRRYEYAIALAEGEQISQAIREANLCFRLDPHDARFKRLLRTLERRQLNRERTIPVNKQSS